MGEIIGVGIYCSATLQYICSVFSILILDTLKFGMLLLKR